MTAYGYAHRLSSSVLFAVTLAAVAATTSAQASVEISAKPTHNMNCTGGVCAPTAKNADLNATDLANMLATSDIKVVTGSGAVTIGILSPLTWASTNRLTLDANASINIKAPVVVEGTTGLTIVTNDGGTDGDLMIYPGGKINFWDTRSSLVINGSTYLLVADLRSLKRALRANPRGRYALSNDLDLHGKIFEKPPISEFSATFEGLGNNIINLDVEGSHKDCQGMFDEQTGTIRDVNLRNVHIVGTPYGGMGALVGCNHGSVINASVDGSVSGQSSTIGGLVGENWNSIARSRSAASVTDGGGSSIGGLLGSNVGTVDRSYSTGSVETAHGGPGGFVGVDDGQAITNCYATGAVNFAGPSWAGGFVGDAEGKRISNSYSTGAISGSGGDIGGFVGHDSTGGFAAAYWDLDTSGINDPSQGAGNIANDQGITGLTDVQLKSGFPAGFDKKVWGQNAAINNGYPYLIANPPQ